MLNIQHYTVWNAPSRKGIILKSGFKKKKDTIFTSLIKRVPL